jgi:hypothetical protein
VQPPLAHGHAAAATGKLPASVRVAGVAVVGVAVSVAILVALPATEGLRHGGEHHSREDDAERVDLGEALEHRLALRLLLLRIRDELRELCRHRVSWCGVDAHGEHARLVGGACGDGSARSLAHGHRLSCEHALVDLVRIGARVRVGG